jgi:hypothetical protein
MRRHRIVWVNFSTGIESRGDWFFDLAFVQECVKYSNLHYGDKARHWIETTDEH